MEIPLFSTKLKVQWSRQANPNSARYIKPCSHIPRVAKDCILCLQTLLVTHHARCTSLPSLSYHHPPCNPLVSARWRAELFYSCKSKCLGPESRPRLISIGVIRPWLMRDSSNLLASKGKLFVFILKGRLTATLLGNYLYAQEHAHNSIPCIKGE